MIALTKHIQPHELSNQALTSIFDLVGPGKLFSSFELMFTEFVKLNLQEAQQMREAYQFLKFHGLTLNETETVYQLNQLFKTKSGEDFNDKYLAVFRPLQQISNPEKRKRAWQAGFKDDLICNQLDILIRKQIMTVLKGPLFYKYKQDVVEEMLVDAANVLLASFKIDFK